MSRSPWIHRRLLAAVPLLLVLLTPAVLSPPTVAAAKESRTFTLVVIPDTQLAVQNKPELFDAQTQWIVENHRSQNIPFVIHLGDVVEWPSRVSDWDRAVAAMYRLNGRVPYAVAVGNHDMDAWACTPEATCDPWPGHRPGPQHHHVQHVLPAVDVRPMALLRR